MHARMLGALMDVAAGLVDVILVHSQKSFASHTSHIHEIDLMLNITNVWKVFSSGKLTARQ